MDRRGGETILGEMNQERSQWAILAGTRFILASVVLIGHLDLLPGRHPWTFIGPFLNQGSAVYGFLMISGYSIAASLERSTEGFLARRARRIWPSYLFSLAIGLAVALAVKSPIQLADQISLRPLLWAELLASITMTQTFLAPALSADGQIWTLAVEWWDYMAAPFLRRRPTRFLLAILAVSLALFILSPPPSNPADLVGGKMFVILAWWWLAGFLYYRHRGTTIGYVLLLAPPLIAAVNEPIGRAAVIGAIALAGCRQVIIPAKMAGALNWLGDLSYPLYLVHIPILFGLYIAHIFDPVFVAGASVSASIFVLYFVDIPFRKHPEWIKFTSLGKPNPQTVGE